MVSFLSDATLIKLSFVLFPALVLGFIFDLTPSWKKRVVEYPFLLFSGLICLDLAGSSRSTVGVRGHCGSLSVPDFRSR